MLAGDEGCAKSTREKENGIENGIREGEIAI
jgi:hypothetical protein